MLNFNLTHYQFCYVFFEQGSLPVTLHLVGRFDLFHLQLCRYHPNDFDESDRGITVEGVQPSNSDDIIHFDAEVIMSLPL